MALQDETRLEILSDHYNITFELLRKDSTRRDRLFLYLLILISVILFHMIAPDLVTELFTSFVEDQAGIEDTKAAAIAIDVSFIGAILWFGLLSLAHTYFQTVLHVERQYHYIHILEDQLSSYFGNQAFIREGRHYRSQRRKFSSWTKLIFWILFPALLTVVIGYRVYALLTFSAEAIYLVANVLVTVSLLISLVLYLLALYKKK